MPGVLLFSARIVLELVLAPVRALRRLLGGDEERQPAAAPAEPAPPPPPREATGNPEPRGAGSVGANVRVGEPWPGYDEMGLDDVLTRLQAASEVEVAVTRIYEREHEARQAVLLAAGEAP
jgi:hypothetical protein